jgi:hypothetical protein
MNKRSSCCGLWLLQESWRSERLRWLYKVNTSRKGVVRGSGGILDQKDAEGTPGGGGEGGGGWNRLDTQRYGTGSQAIGWLGPIACPQPGRYHLNQNYGYVVRGGDGWVGWGGGGGCHTADNWVSVQPTER